jgi:hypothetical protein
MLTLDFTPSPASERRDRECDLRAANVGDLRYEVFLGDIEFIANRQDFSARWGWVPLLDFAAGLRALVRDLARTGSGTYEFTESGAELRFAVRDDLVEVRANYVDAIGKIPMTELDDASRQLADEIFNAAVTMHPSLAENAAFVQLKREVD